ncbi:MAG: FkbM family methyltransferase [Terriglobia bacterium]
MHIREGLSRYYNAYGPRGVLAMLAYRLFEAPKEIATHPPGVRNTVHLRLMTSDERAYKQVLLDGEYAFDLPFSPKIIVDAGANIGMASIYFANRYPEAKIIAIEPEASNFAALARNVRPYPAIIPIHAALWNRDGEICVTQPDPATGARGNWAFVTREGDGANVRAITMTTLMKEMQIEAVDVLKIDVEGAEREVFESADWIRNVRCLMIELHDRLRPGCSQVVESAAQGFSKLQRGETTLFLRQAEA